MNKPVIRLAGLTRSFEQGGERIEVLRGVNLEVAPGEIVALLGPSGSGKSTLLQAVGLLEGGFGGEIDIAGVDASRLSADERTELRRDRIGFVYQFHHLLPDFTALENVMLPQLVSGTARAPAAERARELLTALGLAERLDHRPSQLSGGEQQRVAVARALVNNPRMILADEPTGNLDTGSGYAIMQLLSELHRGGRTVVVVSHDIRMSHFATHMVYLLDGKTVSEAEYQAASEFNPFETPAEAKAETKA